METYYLAISQPSPSMSQDIMAIEAVDYADAVEQCQNCWRGLKRGVSLRSTKQAIGYWHRVNDLGNTWDRNTNSGVPAASKIA